MRKGRKIVFALGLVGRVFVSIIIAKYNIFPRDDNGRSRESESAKAICLRILNLITWLC